MKPSSHAVPVLATCSFEPDWIISDQPVPYPLAIQTMENRVDAIIEGEKKELIWLLEHPAIYTAGTSAALSDLKDAARLPVFDTGRGGKYTYHGPGQRVAYALIDLRSKGRDLRAHVNRLEEWLITVLADFGIVGERREGRVGIWTHTPGGEKKIAALGVRVRKWVAYHGVSLNVAPELGHFSGIVPCGLNQFGVTSMKECGVTASMHEVDTAFQKYVFSLTA